MSVTLFTPQSLHVAPGVAWPITTCHSFQAPGVSTSHSWIASYIPPKIDDHVPLNNRPLSICERITNIFLSIDKFILSWFAFPRGAFAQSSQVSEQSNPCDLIVTGLRDTHMTCNGSDCIDLINAVGISILQRRDQHRQTPAYKNCYADFVADKLFGEYETRYAEEIRKYHNAKSSYKTEDGYREKSIFSNPQKVPVFLPVTGSDGKKGCAVAGHVIYPGYFKWEIYYNGWLYNSVVAEGSHNYDNISNEPTVSSNRNHIAAINECI